MSEEPDQEQVFKLIDHLTKRLDDTLRHSQVSTWNIYAVNGAILAAFYFTFKQSPLPHWAFGVGGALSLLLAIVNWLHANLLKNQNDWYKTIDSEIYGIFERLDPRLWPRRLDKARKEIAPAREGWWRIVYPSPRTSPTYVNIHLVLAGALLLAAFGFLAKAFSWV